MNYIGTDTGQNIWIDIQETSPDVGFLKGLNEYRPKVDSILKLAKSGDPNAQWLMGVRFDQGDGVIEDNNQALEWFNKAAKKGHLGAMFNLGAMYVRGDGVPKDIKKAHEIWQKLAKEGHAGSQFQLGLIYILGDGIDKDYVKAYSWLNIAAAKGYGESQSIKDELTKLMKFEQIEKAQKLSREMIEANPKLVNGI
jgi:hypothetical protein